MGKLIPALFIAAIFFDLHRVQASERILKNIHAAWYLLDEADMLDRFRRKAKPDAPQRYSWDTLKPPSAFDWDYANLNPEAVFKAMVMSVEYAHSAAVDGHIAEFGTAWGRTASTIAKAMRAYGDLYSDSDRMHGIAPRKLYLFDSFQGFPKATAAEDVNSPHIKAGLWAEGSANPLTAQQLRAICEKDLPRERIEVFEGWFSATLPTLPASIKFAMVHIDADLYQSTFDVLDHLFGSSHFADGCALLFDDWHLNRASPKHGQRKAWADVIAKYSPSFSEGFDYGIASKRLTIHRS